MKSDFELDTTSVQWITELVKEKSGLSQVIRSGVDLAPLFPLAYAAVVTLKEPLI